MNIDKQRVVVKVGTSVLTGGTPRLSRQRMLDVVAQAARQHAAGHEIVLVSSGAVAAGRERLNFPHFGRSVPAKQMLAAVGQGRLMQFYSDLFDIFDIPVAQVLLTRDDLNHRTRFLNARDTLLTLLDHRIIPIINENDTTATHEIRVGDNDNLSALVANLVEADLLLLLTDQPGLFTADPRAHPHAELIPEVHTIDETLRKLASGSGTTLGTGGMATKLQAADSARRAGTDVVIAAGAMPDVILRIAAGERVGTRFPALETPLENRKRWIFAGPKPSGVLVIDDGAARALVGNGRSLLPAGIIQVKGHFERGDTVSIQTAVGQELARGITRYTSDDLIRIQGGHSQDIEARLGYAYGPVAVHRNDLILV